ncbi:MAG: DUF2155 domain-containing protein [Pseudomonadota bacterium]
MRGIVLALLLGNPAAAQSLNEEHFKAAPTDEAYPGALPPPRRVLPAERPPVTSIESDSAVLRGLDKMTGRMREFAISVGTTQRYERLEISLLACRKPGPGESEDAFAYLVIRDLRRTEADFRGWMLASSPALSALDHPRYDIWVARCSTSSADASEDNAQN